MQGDAPSKCFGPGCKSNSLIKANIIPAGFARALHHEGGYNLGLSEGGAQRARLQLGAFDKTILCGDCDRKLGQLDDLALSFCMSDLPAANVGRIERIPGADCDRLAAFAISVIWRASISRLAAYSEIRLEPLELRARDVAFGVSNDAFAVIANRVTSALHDVRHFYVQPARRRLEGLNAYTMTMGGFQFFVIADNRPVPAKLEPLVINGEPEMVSLAVPLEGMTEYEGMQQIADRTRRSFYVR